jgi:hypothetical protein
MTSASAKSASIRATEADGGEASSRAALFEAQYEAIPQTTTMPVATVRERARSRLNT